MTYRQLTQELLRASVETTRLRFIIEQIARNHLDHAIDPERLKDFLIFTHTVCHFAEFVADMNNKIQDKQARQEH